MRNPKSAQIFLATVLGMQHRERLVFKASEAVDKKYSVPTFVEVYYADLKETTKTNISIKLVDVEGTVIVGKDGKFAGKPIIHNKLKSLFSEEYAVSHFGAINPKFLAPEYVDKFGYSDVNLEVELPEVTKESEIETQTTEQVETQEFAQTITEETTEQVEATTEIAQVVAETITEETTEKVAKKRSPKKSEKATA